MGDNMRNKFALTIVLASTLGIIFTLTNTVFLVEDTNRIVNGLELFKYFTLQSNLIVALYFLLYLISNFKENKVFKKMFGGVVIYISVTFIVFLIFLEPIYSPKGFALAGSILNHYVTPIFVLGFLYHFKSDYSFEIKEAKLWVVYPIIYLGFLLTYGLLTNDYLYPFFHVTEVGVIGVIIALIGITLLFFIMSFSLVKIVSKK